MMKNFKNTAHKYILAIAAFAIAATCLLPTAITGEAQFEPADNTVIITSLSEIADGYDATASSLTYEIEIP